MGNYAWTAAGGGDWNATGDWMPAGVPGPSDTAQFATGGNTYAVTGDGAAAGISVAADQVTFDGNITAGVIGQAAPGLTVTNGGGVSVETTGLLVAASLMFDTGTSLTVRGLLVDTGGGTVDSAVVTGIGANFTAAQAVTFRTLDINNGATFAGNMSLAAGGSLTLDTSAVFGGGALTVTNGALLDITDGFGLPAFTLSESIVLTAGDLTIQTAPTVVLSLDGQISGAGGLAIASSTVALSGANTYAGGTSLQNSTITLTGAGAAGTDAVFLDNSVLTIQADSAGGAAGNTIVGVGGADTVNATAGNQTVFGGQASIFTFQGGAGNATVAGGSGVLIATGGSGHDEIFGGSSGQDQLTAGTGATTLVGGGGTLTAIGSAGDLLVAAAGNTTLTGAASAGNNVFFVSGSGTTVVEAGSGTSTIVNNAAHTTIYGATGTEDVFLSSGNAQLSFVDGFNGGTMNVVGFGSADLLHVFDYPGNEVQAALNSAVVYGSNTVVTLTDNTHIVLFGFTGLSAANFG